MRKDPELGNAFLDIALVGVVTMTIAIVIDLLAGGSVNLGLIAPAVATYLLYVIGALRLGTSPLRYLTTVYKRGSLPR